MDPRWLLKALAALFALGGLCAYLTLCWIFYQGQWQFVLHPSRSVSQTPAVAGLVFSPVHFGPDLAGQSQLTGWWIPGDAPSEPTVLMLHGEDGSMSDAVPQAKALHAAGLNVLLFDYRGYGQSAGTHPDERLMRDDADSAWRYLTETQGSKPASIVVYGAGLGASLAVNLCGRHPEAPALILVSADGDTETRVLRDQRTRPVPLRLLFHERFPLADPLATLKTPKLLISYTQGSAPLIADRAASPKMTVELPKGANTQAITDAVRRFVGTYIVTPPASLFR